jgi:hypothetical protein
LADTLLASVPFAVAADAPSADDGDFVVKNADVVFKAGRYDFPPADGGPFEMTADELKAALADLPAHGVPITDEHNPRSVFYRRGIGRFREPKPSADYAHFGGKVRIARPLAEFLGPGPLRLSANWCRATKRLKDVSLTETPRIPEAAAFAAYAAFAKSEGDTPETTPHGRAAMQQIHDDAARAGALCKGKGKPADAGMASFTSSSERDAFQTVHDMAANMGAGCAVSGGKAREKGDEAMAAYSAEFGPAPSPREKELEARLAKIEAERQSEREAAAKDAEARFSATVASFAAAAETFAASIRDRLLPYMRPLCVADYCRCAEDDLRQPAEVHFSTAEGKPWKGTRLEACKARWQSLPPHGLAREGVRGRAAGEALFAQNDRDPKPMSAERRQALLAMSPVGQAVLRDRRAAGNNGK